MKLDYRRRASGPCAGFTLLELLAVLFIIAIAAAILIPTMNKAHRTNSNRVGCMSNLRQIGQALLLYANENKGAYPRTSYAPGAPLVFSDDATDGSAERNPFGDKGLPGKVADNDVVAAMFLLIRTQDIISTAFICPSADAADYDTFGNAPGANASRKTSFSKWRENLSYSLANPYPGEAAVKAGYVWSSTLGAGFAMVADMNPGVGDGYDAALPNELSGSKEMQKANSPNHQGAGENVLYGDGHVEFQQNPFCGMKRDCIYTNSGTTDGSKTTSRASPSAAAGQGPTWAGDSVLLPALKWRCRVR